MDIYLLIIFIILILVLTAFPVLAFWDFVMAKRIHEQEWRRERKKHEGLTFGEEKTQSIVDEIIEEDAQRKEREEEEERQKKEKLKETLKQPSLLNSLIIRVWQEEINNAIWPRIVIFGKNKKEKVTIETYGQRGKEFPDDVKLALEGLRRLRHYYYADFNELTKEEKEAIENWLVENYQA